MKKIAAVLVIIAMLPMTTLSRAESTSLGTQTGKDIGLSLSYYQYQEPGIMSLKGAKLGLDMQAVKVLQNDQFIRGDLRYAFGSVDYSSNSTGSATGNPDWYIEARGLVGKDLLINGEMFALYTGAGYRYLFNDGRGLSCNSSNCFWGYRRESNYFYWPIGLIHRREMSDQAKLESTLEFDTLLFGKQLSRLSDGGQGDSDVTNHQNSGYGLRLSVMYEKNKWAIGPYASYWNIGESDWVPLYRNGVPVLDTFGRPLGGVEPNNNTIEFGFKANQQF